MKDYTQVQRDNAALTIREYAFGQMNMLRMLGNEDAANNLQEAINMAVAALRGPQPDPDTGLLPCDYCNETHDQKPLLQENKYKPYTCMMSTISIEENNGKHQIEIDLWDGGNVYAAFEINYCPMCGRKLGVEG